jgi:hypothetical protein
VIDSELSALAELFLFFFLVVVLVADFASSTLSQSGKAENKFTSPQDKDDGSENSKSSRSPPLNHAKL